MDWYEELKRAQRALNDKSGNTPIEGKKYTKGKKPPSLTPKPTRHGPAAITPVQSSSRITYRERNGRMVPVESDNRPLPSVTAQDLATKYWEKMRPLADRARAERGLDPYTQDEVDRQLGKIAARMDEAMRNGELLPSQFRSIWNDDPGALQAQASSQAIALRNASVLGNNAPMYLFYGRG